MDLLSLDRVTEVASRWLAARLTRRSFFSTTGKTALVLAGGSALSEVFALRADARLCGQSGVSNKCPTFDCVGDDLAWGWCWYASPGCCANGGLKKICDCCKRNHPNVQGYCPEGSAVFCVVESCLEDPRLQSVPVERYVGADAVDISLARSAQRRAGSAPVIVMANGLDPLISAIAGPVASALGAPLLLADPEGTRPGVHDELDRLETKRIIIVGPALAGIRLRYVVESIAQSGGPAAVSVEVARWFEERGPLLSVVVIGSSTNAARLAAVASTYAATRHVPLLVGVESITNLNTLIQHGFGVLLIGAEVAEAPIYSTMVGAIERIGGKDPSVISQLVGDRLLGKLSSATFPLVVVADGSSSTAVGAFAPAGVVVVHGDAAIDPALRDWLIANRKRFSNADLIIAGNGSLSDQGVYDLQSALNGYQTQLLIGHDAQGLPVIAQPIDEREIGKAKISGIPLPPSTIATKASAKRRLPPAPNPAPAVFPLPTRPPKTVPPVSTATSTTLPASTLTAPTLPVSTLPGPTLSVPMPIEPTAAAPARGSQR